MAGLHYASETGERSDELSIAEVQALIAAGTITEETLVCGPLGWARGSSNYKGGKISGGKIRRRR